MVNINSLGQVLSSIISSICSGLLDFNPLLPTYCIFLKALLLRIYIYIIWNLNTGWNKSRFSVICETEFFLTFHFNFPITIYTPIPSSTFTHPTPPEFILELFIIVFFYMNCKLTFAPRCSCRCYDK